MKSSIFIARQEIRDLDNKIVAYELLFRNSLINSYPENVKSHIATEKTIKNSLKEIGLDKVSNGKKILINVDERSLHTDLILSLPTNNVGIEILEDVPCSKENIKRISFLADLGFKIILDDFVLNQETIVLLDYCHVIKIDIKKTPLINILNDLKIYKERNIKILAEKIETLLEYEECKKNGFNFFQGYYFSKPEMLIK